MSVYVVGVLAVFAAGCIQGCAGFGFALIALPPLLMVLPPTSAVPIIAMVSQASVVYMAVRYREHVRLRLVAPLAAGGVSGIPIGIYFLERLDGPVFKTILGGGMVGLALLLFSGRTYPIRNTKAALPAVGLVSGILSGSTSLSGPPVVLFLSNQGTPKDIFRANMVAYFTATGIFAIAGFAIRGYIGRAELTYAAAFAPAVALAIPLGMALSKRVSEDGFRKGTMIAVAVMGAWLALANVAE